MSNLDMAETVQDLAGVQVRLIELSRQQFLDWAHKYDVKYPWVIEKEREVGDRLRLTGELTKADLKQIIEWKFEFFKGRQNKVLRYAEGNDDLVLRKVSRIVFELNKKQDEHKLNLLCAFKGVKISVASVILTFYDPQNYGVFDTHVRRELFADEPVFTVQGCLWLFNQLRILSVKHGIPARTIEKALFQKNKDST